MNHPTWGCAEPKCINCELENKIMIITQLLEKEIEYKSTGWYIYFGMRTGYKVLQKELNLK